MTKKDYELIAKALRHALGTVEIFGDAYTPEEVVSLAIHVTADALERENPRFDRKRFISASTMTDRKAKAIEKALSN